MKPGSPRNHATNIPGLYACGECDYGYHGANRLGANSLLSASFSGRVAGEAISNYLKGLQDDLQAVPEQRFNDEISRQRTINKLLTESQGMENPYTLHHELGELMSSQVGVVRDNTTLQEALSSLQDLGQRSQAVNLRETNTWSNQALVFTRQLQDMIRLGQVITASALARDECRGAHYKPAFDLTAPKDAYPGDPAYEAYRDAWKQQNKK